MNVRLPVVPSGLPATNYLNLMVQFLTRAFSSVVSKDEETPRIILRSPNGTNYDVTVSDAGALVITPTEKTRA